MTDSATASPPTPPRKRRWLRRILVALLAVLVLLVGAVVVVVRGLDQPWLKRHVQDLARSSAGLDVDYRATHLAPTSLRIEDLVVLTPEKLRDQAPELARVGVVEARWTLDSLRSKDGPLLTGLSLEHVAVALVGDEKRGSTLDALSSPAPAPAAPAPPAPLSRALADALASPLPVARIDLTDVGVELIRSTDGRTLERISLRGLGVRLATDRAPAGGWGLAVEAGTAAVPLELALERAGHGSAKLRLALKASASPASAQASLDLRAVEQTLVKGLAVEKVLALEASARFDPKAGQVEATVARLEAADGSIAAQASVVLPDKGAPLLREAKGEIDLAQALRHVPEGLVSIPVALEAGTLSFRVSQLTLAAVPSLAAEGSAQADAAVQGLQVNLDAGTAKAPAVKLTLQVQPKEKSALAGQAVLSLDRLEAAFGARKLDGDGVEVTLGGTMAEDGAVDAKLDLRLKRLAASAGATLSAAQAHLGLKVQGLHVDLGAPMASRGRVELDLQAATLGAVAAPWRVDAANLGLEARTKLAGAAPFALDLDLPVGKLEVTGEKKRSYLSAPARLRVGLEDVFPDLDRPLRTRAKAKIALDLGAAHVTLDTTKQVDAADYVLGVDASSLALARPVMPEGAGWQLPLEKMAVAFKSSGRVDKLSSKSPTLTQRAELKVERPGLKLASGAGSADRLELNLNTDGNASRHKADGTLAVRGLVVGETKRGDGALTLNAAVDLDAASARLKLDGGGEAGPSAGVDLAASFDRAKKTLSYDLSAQVGKLTALADLLKGRGGLAGFDLERLEASVTAKGALAGVVEAISIDGKVQVAPEPLATLAGESRFEVKVGGFGWKGGDQEVALPAASLQGRLESEAGQHTLHGDMRAEAIHLELGRHVVDLEGLSDSLEVKSADLAAGAAELRQRLQLRGVKQDYLPEYPVGDLTLVVQAQRDREGTIKASLIQLENGAAGTTLKLDGTAELGGYRRALSLRGELEQDLARAWTAREDFEGKGKFGLQLRVESSDLRIFHAQGEAKFTGAQLRLPKAGWAVESLDAEIPAQADLVAGADGLKLKPQAAGDAFAQLRFADQHPFKSRRSFLSIARLVTPAVTVAPLAGNLEISKGVILLSQLELGAAKGVVTGQCALLYQGKEPTLVARVRASGIESSYGEPFDGNLAISISMRERRVDGRAEILRIGRRHLLDLLDIQDPYHADGSFNRIRSALALGYPEHVRLTFRQGFASLGVTFGGAARVVTLDEVRGIPVGPLLDKALAGVSGKDAAR